MIVSLPSYNLSVSTAFPMNRLRMVVILNFIEGSIKTHTGEKEMTDWYTLKLIIKQTIGEWKARKMIRKCLETVFQALKFSFLFVFHWKYHEHVFLETFASIYATQFTINDAFLFLFCSNFTTHSFCVAIFLILLYIVK